jgi:serine/threonine protein kinase
MSLTAVRPSRTRRPSGDRPRPTPQTQHDHGDGRWRLTAGETIAPGRHALSLLGGGNRYEAYLAWDDALGSPVVAKLLRPHLIDHDGARLALKREARALSRLQHPVIVRAFDAVLDGERPHLCLEFLDGPRLSTLLRKWGPLSAEQVVLLARQLASALHFMAGHGWVHLDVKPRNIIMTGSPRLIDLSVARPIGEISQISSHVGTDSYMAPEQCDPDRWAEIGPPADMWGLAVTIYETLTQERAFRSDSNGGRFPQLRSRPPRMPAKAPTVLAEAVEAAMSPDPQRRPTAMQFYEQLEPLAEWAHRHVRRVR